MPGDWIRTYRDALEHPVFQDDWLWRLFSWCLLKANYKEALFRGQVIAPGQFVTGRIRAADELHVAPSKWYRGMVKLSQPPYDCITIKSNSDWTTVTIRNWQTYQTDALESEQQVNSERTASEQQTDTRERKQKGKKGKREEVTNTATALAPIPASLATDAFQAAWNLWVEYRRQRKPAMTLIASQQQLENLAEMGEQRAIAAIKHSIASNYQGIYEKGNSNGHQRTFNVGPGQRYDPAAAGRDPNHGVM